MSKTIFLVFLNKIRTGTDTVVGALSHSSRCFIILPDIEFCESQLSYRNMNCLVLLLAAAALLSDGCRSANINKHMKLLSELDNNIEPNAVPKSSAARKFVTLTRQPGAVVAHRAGTTLALTCEGLGTPAPGVRWLKNDEPIYEYDVESNEIIDTNPHSLARVTSTLLVTRTAAQDRYTCLITAAQKTARATTVVYRVDGGTELTERSRLLPLEPRILVSYKVYMDEIGNSIVLPCRAKGHPRPHIVWRDNKGSIIKQNPRMKVLRSGELVILHLRWSDMGEFTCEASNAFGSQEARTFVYPARAG